MLTYTYPEGLLGAMQQRETPEEGSVHAVAASNIQTTLAPNYTPNVYNPQASRVIGEDTYQIANNYRVWPEHVDTRHYVYHVNPDVDSNYRSALQAPRRESAVVRIFAASLTAPGSEQSFVGTRVAGDVYGG